MLKTFVKINQVNNLSDARYCAGMGVHDLGFNVEAGTLHYLAPEEYQDIINWVAGVRTVAELTTAQPEGLATLLRDYSVDAVEVATPEQLSAAVQMELPLIFRTSAAALPAVVQRIRPYQPQLDYIVVSAESVDEISRLADYSKEFKLVITGNFSAEEFEKLLAEHPALYGIALTGGEEIRAGYKDFDELAEILEALEAEDNY